MHQAVLKRLDDADWGVRRQLAASLGAMTETARDAAAMLLLDRYGDDPITMDAALSGLRGREMNVLDRLMRDDPPQTPQREASIAMLAATIVRGGEEEPVQALFAWLADERRGAWRRGALMRGAEIALLGAIDAWHAGAAPGCRRERRGSAVPDVSGRPRGPRRGIRLCATANRVGGRPRRGVAAIEPRARRTHVTGHRDRSGAARVAHARSRVVAGEGR